VFFVYLAKISELLYSYKIVLNSPCTTGNNQSWEKSGIDWRSKICK